MTFGENQKGKTFAFMTFSPFESLWGRLFEIVVLIGAHAASIQVAVRGLKFLHYGHFTRVPPGALERAGIRAEGKLRQGGFLFNSAYNGDAEVYFRGFSDNLTGPMNELWSRTVGWVNASPYENLERYIHRYQRSVTAHVNGYPSFATAIRRALEVRNQVDGLTSLALTMTDEEFERAYGDAAMQIWG